MERIENAIAHVLATVIRAGSAAVRGVVAAAKAVTANPVLVGYALTALVATGAVALNQIQIDAVAAVAVGIAALISAIATRQRVTPVADGLLKSIKRARVAFDNPAAPEVSPKRAQRKAEAKVAKAPADSDTDYRNARVAPKMPQRLQRRTGGRS